MDPTEAQRVLMASLRAWCEEQGVPCYNHYSEDGEVPDGEFVALIKYGCRFTYHLKGKILGKWWTLANSGFQADISRQSRFAPIVWADYCFNVGGALDAISEEDVAAYRRELRR